MSLVESRLAPAATAALIGIAALLMAAPARAADDQRPMMLAVDGDQRTELPLVRGRMAVEVRGPIASVHAVHTFANTGPRPIEAIYVFPLHQHGAVGAMSMHLGPRTIRAVIRRRAEAQAAYQEARAQGKTAALLEQERPNIFTQSVANILPGEQIEVELTYDVLLEPDGDVYELALPTVVGPRYVPGAPVDRPPTGSGVRADTDRVPDASRISPPAVPPGVLTGNLFAIDLDVMAGLPVADVSSPTHRIATTQLAPDHVTVTLADGDMVANADFVLQWRVAVAEPTVAALADHSGDRGYLALMLQPPAVPAGGPVPARELVFVVDTSGSMTGEPLALAKRAMRHALDHLRPQDSFRILNFSSDVSGFAGGARRAATRANVRAGLSFINGLRPGGGTEMLSGIVAALDQPPADGRTRFVCFMTDGYIGNEDEIMAAVDRGLTPGTHLFSFGVGSSTNRHLLDGLARHGQGVAQYLLLDAPPAPQIERFYSYLDEPLLTDLTVDWGGLAVTDTTPGKLGALFAGQPIIVTGRYRDAATGTITVRGRTGDTAVTMRVPVTLPAAGGDGPVLARLWARRTIAALMDRMVLGDRDLEPLVTDIALTHSLMSPYTSFVAIDEQPRAEGLPTDTVVAPVELPAGVTPAAGNVITSVYASNVPVPGRTFESALGAAAGSQGDSLGYSFGGSSSLENEYIIVHAERRLLLRLDAGGGLGLRSGDGGFGEVGLGADLRVGRRLAAALSARLLAAGDRATTFELLASLVRLAVLGRLDLRLGAGGAYTTDGDLGLAWRAELAVPIRVGRVLPEVTVGTSGSTAGDDHLGVGLGVGVRF